MSLEALTTAEVVVASFHAGTTAGGHHWTIEDQSGTELFRTRRVHTGGVLARAAWKAVTLTGMDAGNDIHVDLLGPDGTAVARLSSENAKPAVVTATGPAGEEIARSVHDGPALTLGGGAVVDVEGDGPWPVRGAGGESLGELLGGEPGPSTTATWTELLLPYAPNQSSDFARTMHLGLRRVTRYAFKPEGRPPVESALLPLLAGLTY
jgi:hypothetical protein